MNKVLVVGSLNMDCVINLPRRPKPGETVFGSSFKLVPGGKGANQAYALGRMGVDTSMIGALGKDDFGRKLLQNLQSAGVNTDGVVQYENLGTGKAFITVEDNGQNSIIVLAEANAAVDVAMLDKHPELLATAEAVVMQLEVPMPVIKAAAHRVREHGGLVILDPAPARADIPDELLAAVDIIKPNETELAKLTGMPTTTREEMVQAARSLLTRGAKAVLLSLGGDGSAFIDAGQADFFPAEKVKAVDTTAAGDCFTAAFVARLQRQPGCMPTRENVQEAIRFATVAASIAVTRPGAQTSIPSLAEVEVRLH